MVMTEAWEGLKHDRNAVEAVIAALAAMVGNRLVTSQRGPRAARQHAHLDRQPAARRGGVSADDRGSAADRAAVRGAPRADHRLRHRHLARRPGQRAARRHLARFPRHEPRARRPRRGSRLRRRARRHAQAAQRIPARSGPVLSDRSRRRRLARRHGGDARVRHQCGALRHHEGQRAGAESRARQRRGDVDGAAGEEIVGRLRSHAPDGRLRRHARHHHRADAAPCRHPGGDRRPASVRSPRSRRPATRPS